MKKAKAGINQPLTCKKCGANVGYVTIKPRLKWKMLGWMGAVAFVFELLSNVIVYVAAHYLL